MVLGKFGCAAFEHRLSDFVPVGFREQLPRVAVLYLLDEADSVKAEKAVTTIEGSNKSVSGHFPVLLTQWKGAETEFSNCAAALTRLHYL